ncbi:cysteine hydrolase family protein [Shinella pollutisoli]|uniref:Cysteine hydrolase family protein n=1 Tax=Shinella pollutisoli TaxID=2250594 RepID=A0ABV7DM42_9HYPH|nr:cysteine hydrolase [Shinella pollutisoli]
MIGNWRHICVDMQRMFAEDTPWKVSWMDLVSPQVVDVAARFSRRTIFTRFCPPARPADAPGMWRAYYEKWWMMTQEHLPAELLGLVPELAPYCPPALVFDKRTYSPWMDGRLHAWLSREAVETLVITGGETDVCVLGTALGGIDLGYRVVVLKDAVCSGTDETHDASLKLLGSRFSAQVELMTTEEFLASDPPAG